MFGAKRETRLGRKPARVDERRLPAAVAEVPLAALLAFVVLDVSVAFCAHSLREALADFALPYCCLLSQDFAWRFRARFSLRVDFAISPA